MRFCPYCGKETDNDMSFCPFCGKALAATLHNHDTQLHQQTTALTKAKPHSLKKALLPLLAVIVIAIVLLLTTMGGNFSEDTEAIGDAAYSVVLLNCYDYDNILSCTGSGFAAIDKDIIITNHHVIKGNVYRIEAVREDGSTFPIESVITYDEGKDFAILRAPEHQLTPLELGDSANLNKGEKTVAIGSPTGFKNTVSTGIFSNYLNVGNYFQILSTASLSPGSSGGALFNELGQVIGITSGEYTSGNDLYYSIPIHYVQELYNNRSPEDELTIAEFYGLSEHPYTVDYILAYGNKLHNRAVLAQGYISAIDGSRIYLVSAPERVLFIDSQNFDLETTLALRSDKYALQTDLARNKLSTGNLSCGDFISAEGTVQYYSADDIRFIADKIYP